jgi:hypothetical protein
MATITANLKFSSVGVLSPKHPNHNNAILAALVMDLDALGFRCIGVSIAGLDIIAKVEYEHEGIFNFLQAEDEIHRAIAHDRRLALEDFVIDPRESEFDALPVDNESEWPGSLGTMKQSDFLRN